MDTFIFLSSQIEEYAITRAKTNSLHSTSFHHKYPNNSLITVLQSTPFDPLFHFILFHSSLNIQNITLGLHKFELNVTEGSSQKLNYIIRY